jgi:hypothetical protein
MTSLKCWTPVAKKCVNKCVNCYENTFVFDKTQTEGKNGILYIYISDDNCKGPCPLYTTLTLQVCNSVCLTKGKQYNFNYVDVIKDDQTNPTEVFYQTGTIIEPKTCIGTTLIKLKSITENIADISNTVDGINNSMLTLCDINNKLTRQLTT